ncbi:hypothetical protein GCM10027037_03300 [Mucilaginibacter koreensis]
MKIGIYQVYVFVKRGYAIADKYTFLIPSTGDVFMGWEAKNGKPEFYRHLYNCADQLYCCYQNSFPLAADWRQTCGNQKRMIDKAVDKWLNDIYRNEINIGDVVPEASELPNGIAGYIKGIFQQIKNEPRSFKQSKRKHLKVA